ncbi:MAG: C39 family peptidase, partial [Anaerolineae bacterium]
MNRTLALFVIAITAAALCAAAAGLATWLWQQTAQVERLDDRLEALSSDAILSGTQVAALEATVAALESQRAHAGSGPEATATPAVAPRSDEDLEAMAASLADLAARVDRLEAQPAALAQAATPDAGDLAPAPLPRVVRLDVAPQRQGHNLSCESAAAAMAAQYHGVDLSEAEIMAALPHHANPHLGFRGNVDGSPGGLEDYGVYASPIVDVLNAHGLDARRSDGGLASIRAVIARGNPVVAWITYNCQASAQGRAPTTITVEGERVTLVPFE